MRTRTVDALFVLAMVAVLVTVDVVFLRHHFAPRLFANVGIVLAFVTLYLTVLKRH